MPSILANAIQHHRNALGRVAGVAGVYVRGSTPIEEIELVRGSVDTAGETVEDMAVLSTDSEWIVSAEDLILDGKPIKPEKGDEIKVPREGGGWELYKVLRPTDDQECWRFSDQFHVMIRIYTKYRGVVDE